MRILVVGLGSIGKRHLGNILSLGYKEITLVSRNPSTQELYPDLKVYKDLPTALAAQEFDAAVLCTPTAQHTAGLLAILQAQIGMIYLEKPVSHNFDGWEKVLQAYHSYKPWVCVGFDLHFDPGLGFVKKQVQEGAIGQLLTVNAFVGQYLPDWRPHEDYRKGMSAQKATGGGVMLDLVHEFDYLQWLAGSAEEVACMHRQSGSLEIETEDTADVLIRFKSGITGSLHLDYLQRQLIRQCVLTGTEGSMIWDLARSEVKTNFPEGTTDVYSYKGFERNDRFVSIIKAFLEKTDDDRLTSLEEGISSLKMVLAAKESSETRTFKTIN
jgi:predicted dehydrogenase